MISELQSEAICSIVCCRDRVIGSFVHHLSRHSKRIDALKNRLCCANENAGESSSTIHRILTDRNASNHAFLITKSTQRTTKSSNNASVFPSKTTEMIFPCINSPNRSFSSKEQSNKPTVGGHRTRIRDGWTAITWYLKSESLYRSILEISTFSSTLSTIQPCFLDQKWWN